jgi:hypothetical protein
MSQEDFDGFFLLIMFLLLVLMLWPYNPHEDNDNDLGDF